MFKKTVRYLLIVFGIAALWASTSRTAMQSISDFRDTTAWWGSYQKIHGDLIGRTYLDFVKKLVTDNEYTVKRPAYNGPKNTELYLFADSYGWHMADTAFAGVSGFHFINKYTGGTYHLDSTKKNILIILFTERSIRDYLDLGIFNSLRDTEPKHKSTAFNNTAPGAKACYASVFPDFSIDDLFNSKINQNLQFNLFNYHLMIPVFKVKAAFNYYVFNRASGDVVLSQDHNFLFIKETVMSTYIGSSYYASLTTDDISRLVNNFNAVYDHYKAEGFNEVYLSIIPNPSTIVQPQGYDNMIPLIQDDPRLRMKLIDMYTTFKNSTELLFRPGDTHWNNKGLQTWLDTVNEKIVRVPDK